MLTIDEIKNVSFRKANFGGYRDDEVDNFIDEVIASFEQLKKEKTNLVHKIDTLAQRLEQYRADEETVRNALLSSQKISDACIKEAKEKAARIIRDAEAKANAIISEADKTIAVEKNNYVRLQKDAVDLRNELIELYKEHIKNIGNLPTSVDLEKTKAELDTKYPTDDYSVDEAVKSVAEISSQSVEPSDSNDNTEDAPKSVPKDNAKKSEKFRHLKFGDNYDVSAE